MRAASLLHVLCAAFAVAGCSSVATGVGSACGSACAEFTGRLLCSAANSICQGDDDFDGDADGDAAPDPAIDNAKRLAEAPPPAWQPEPGRAACEVKEADGFVTVSCADGARAVFVAGPPAAIVLEEDAGAGDPCSGRARKQGLDSDGDGALSAQEIVGRVLVCASESEVFSPTLWGDLAILGPDDVVLAAARRAVTGGLTLVGDRVVELSLPQLRSIGGSLRAARAPQLRALSFERLARVGADVSLTALPALVDVDLPVIREVGGAVIVTDNPALPQRALERVVVRLSRKGFSGPVVSGGNAP